MEIKKLVDTEKVVGWRRHLHMYPEVAFEEFKTAEYIVSELSKYPDVEILRPAGTSVVGVLRGGKPGKIVGLRADFDALPITEEADVEFKSKNPGVMHACAHDCHTAMLLGAVDVLCKIKDDLCGTVKFIFQHAEELLPGGAQEIVDSGALSDVQGFYTMHLENLELVGVLNSAPGAVSANTDSFTIEVHGKGAHAAEPHTSIDSLLIGTEIVQALNFIVSRNVANNESAVLTVAAFNSGSTFNIIPDTAEIKGTVRTFSGDVRELIERRIVDITAGICAAHGATCNVKYERGYSSVINDEKLCEFFNNLAIKKYPNLEIKKLLPTMGGEDFSAYGAIAPILYVALNARPKSGEVYNFHHPKFCIDEDVLPIGTALYADFAWEFNK